MSKRINVTVSDNVYEKLKVISEEYGMPVSSLGSMAIMTWLEHKQVLSSIGDLNSLMGQMGISKVGEKE